MPTLYGTPAPVPAPPAAPDAPEGVETAATVQKPAERKRIAPERMRAMFGSTDDFLGAFQPQTQERLRQRLGTSPDAPGARQRLANTIFLADRFNLTAKEVSARYSSLRDQYARTMFPDRLNAGTMDDGVFFTNAGRLLGEEQQGRETMVRLDRLLFNAAVDGKDFGSAFEAARATGEIPGKRLDVANAWALDRWEANRTRAAKLAPIIETVADTMRAIRTREGTPDEDRARWEATVDQLATLDESEAGLTLSLAAERAMETERVARPGEAGAKPFGAFIQGTSDLVADALTGLYQTAETTMGHTDAQKREFRRYQIERSFEQMVFGEIDPIKADTFAGQVALDFVRSTPAMLAALTPQGLAMDFFALKEQARQRLEQQGMAGETAERVATVQAIPQTALFFATSKMVFLGKVPAAFGKDVATTLATEYVGNFALNEAGHLTDAGIQSLASTLSDNVPDVDWQQFGQSFKDRLPEQLAFAIPGALIGTGTASFRNRKAGEAYLKHEPLMEDLGFTPEAKQAVAEATTYAETEQAFKDGYATRDIESEAAIELDLQRTREAAQGVEAGVVFEALKEEAPQADPKTVKQLASIESEIREDEEALGKLKPRQRVRRKAVEARLEALYRERLQLQAELDIPGARDALVQYEEAVGRSATPTRLQSVWEYVTKRKLPTVKRLRELGAEGGEIADLELPRRVFDPQKRHGIDSMGQSLVEWLADNGDPDAAKMLERGEQFTPREVVDLIGEAYRDFKERERTGGEIPVPRIEYSPATTKAIAEAPPLPQPTPTVSALQGEIEQVRPMTGRQFQEWSNQQPGGFTKTAHEWGKRAAGRDDVNALLQAQEDANQQLADVSARAKRGDMDAMDEMMLLSTKAQVFREAYEAALGILSAGKRLRELDPAFQSPIVRNPDGSYTVRAAPDARPVVAATPEGAAMVAEAQKTEAAQQSATQPPEPHPENDDARLLPPRITALNKEAIAALRALFNLEELPAPTRERFEQVLDDVKRTNGSAHAGEIAADILANRRVSTAREHAALVLRSAELQNAYEQKAQEIGEAFAAGDLARAEALRTVADNLQRELDQLTEASDRTGTEIARALSIRRMRVNRDDYTLAKLVQRARTAKKGDLTTEQTAQLADVTKQLEEQAKVVTEQKAKLAQQDIELARAKAETFVAEGRARRRRAVAQDAATRRKALKAELLKMGVRVNDITSLIPGSFEWARIVAKIADTYIEEGVASLAELTNKLKADIPDLSDQDIYMAVGRQTKAEAKKIETEAKTRVRELRAQAALWAKINAALEGTRPDGSPVNRKQQNKLLRETLTELRRQANRTTFDDEALKRIDAKIREVQGHLAAGTRPAPVPRPEGNQKLADARRVLTELRQEMGALDTIAELERMVGEAEPKPAAEGKPTPPPDPTEQQQRLNRLRERIAELRDEIDQAQVDPAAVNAERLARLQRLAAELEEQIEGGFREMKPAKSGVSDSDAVAAARRQVRELERLMRTDDSIADLEEQIRTGEFKVSAPERRLLSNARLEQALIRQKQLRRQADELIERMRTKSLGERVVDVALIPRTLIATADMSAMLRQGLLLSVSRPREAMRAFSASLRAMFDQNTADAIQLAIERRPGWQRGESAGLFLSETGGSMRAAEEHFMSNVAERIPGISRVVRASNRAMVTTLNMLRVAAFDGFANAHPEASPEQLKAYARYVNAASGRGNVKWSPSTVKAMNAVFFAPRYAVSRFQALYSPLKNFNDPLVRNAILKDFGALVGTGLSVMTLAALAGAEVEFDPTDSDFGKIVVDDTRIDIWGGLQQPARLVLSVPAALANRTDMAELEKDVDPLESALQFMSYKVSPAISVPRALLTGEDAVGQEQEIPETLLRAITPLTLQETVDVYQNTGDPLKAGGALVGGFFGLGISEQPEKK